MAIEYAVRQARGFDKIFGLDKLELVIAMANVVYHYPQIGDFPVGNISEAASEATSQYLDAVRRVANKSVYKLVERRVAEFHQDLFLTLNGYNKEAFTRVKTALIDLDDYRLALVEHKKNELLQ